MSNAFEREGTSMAIPSLHPLNLLWLVGDPSEMRALNSTLGELTARALDSEDNASLQSHAVIIGALPSPTGACLFDTEVIVPKVDSLELRPTYNTIFEVCDSARD